MSYTVKCNCGEHYDITGDEEADKHIACPVCGSKDGIISGLEVVALSSTTGMDTILIRRPPLDFLLKTIIVPRGRSTEGRIIEAVAIPWLEIIALMKDDPSKAFEIPPDKWEEIVAGAYTRAGFDEVILTPRSGDRGRDVIAVKKSIGYVRVIDQVKAYKPGHLVNANDVRALMGVLQGDGASKAFLTTTSDFAPRIKDDPLIVPFIPTRLELINGPTLLGRLWELSGKYE